MMAEGLQQCIKCKELRSLPLHLFELSLYCDLLACERTFFERSKGKIAAAGTVRVKTIANWLRLAAQVEKVILDTHIFQISDLYCEPVNETLIAEAQHHQQIITPLTRLIFVFNALEEAYRLCSSQYEDLYDLKCASARSTKYLKSFSAQAAYVLHYSLKPEAMPRHYNHLQENLRKVAKRYSKDFHSRFDVDLDDQAPGIDYGLLLIRNLRNQIAHGVFPIIDNPDVVFSTSEIIPKRNLINLLNQASRLSAMSIQALLKLTGIVFESELYFQQASDDEYGEYFRNSCTPDYLNDIHLKNDFGLNEKDFFQMISRFDESGSN